MRCLDLRNRRGVVIVIVAIALVVLLGMAAIAIDIGQLYAARQKGQNACDAAALAGILPLSDTADELSSRETRATEVALQTATGNNEVSTWQALVPGSDEGGVEVTFPTGTLNDDAGDPILDEDGNVRSFAEGEAIRTRAEVPVTFGFARIFGFTSRRVSASATAIVEESKGFCSPLYVPLAVSDQDILGTPTNPDPIEFGAQHVLHVSDFDGGFLGPGNYLSLAFEGDVGKADYVQRLAGNADET